jgi:hypothetical protein
MFFRRPVTILLLLLLAACAVFNPPAKQRQAALDDFMYALRWQRYPEAAAFMIRDHREAFLDQMEPLKDLNVTEVRLQRAELSEEGLRAETRLEMDYYLLPSTTLKTLRIDQTWRWFETGDGVQRGFLITTPFPNVP